MVVEHLRRALAHLDEALAEASEELVQLGFSERSARSVVSTCSEHTGTSRTWYC
jgi:Holliday junction resolvasome RuvABC DNA-binding subunit